MARKKSSDAPQVQGKAPAIRFNHSAPPDMKDGLWFLVARHLEHNGVAYLPVSHHLVQSNSCPERIPSMGAKGRFAGDNTVPVDKTGMINLAGETPSSIYQLAASGTIPILRMTPQIQQLFEEGKRASATIAPALVPPMRRITGLNQQYEQATNVPLTGEGAQHLAVAQQTMPSPF